MTHPNGEPGPGPFRVAISNLGCKVNFAEMSLLASRLSAAGIDVVDEHQPADIRVVNSCTVTKEADRTSRQKVFQLTRLDPASSIIFTGCSVDGNPETYRKGKPPFGIAKVVPNGEKEAIFDMILRSATGSPPSTSAPRFHRSRSFLKVQDGCRHSCTYCSVWSARGPSRSIPEDDVLRTAKRIAAEGYREIVLTGVDLGSYGRDCGTTLASLVERLLALPFVRIRLSSINANDITPALIKLNARENFCSHWHIPLQSGSDAILKSMHRGYRSDRYRAVCRMLAESNPSTTVTTDIMTAFPGETEEDHEATLSLMDEVRFLKAHVFRYSRRDGTPASHLDEIDPEIAKRRSRELRQRSDELSVSHHEAAVGTVLHPLWYEASGGLMRGIAETYFDVLLPDTGVAIGEVDPVLIESTNGNELFGRKV